jgi:hypothetical protein
MSLCGPFRRIGDRQPPPAYGGCHCSCHRTVGMVHVAACCGPGRGDTLLEEPICRIPAKDNGSHEITDGEVLQQFADGFYRQDP